MEQQEGIMSSVTHEALEALDRAGQIAEDSGRLDVAITCYEKALLTRNHFWGDQHIDVAKSLVNVGRVLELQGNTEGSLDLYRAAQTIYATQVTAKEFVVNSDEVETVLQLIPSLFEQGRYEEAVAYLNKCLESEPPDEKKTESNLDRNQIYFTLGEAYIGMGDYVSATVCLVECTKQEGAVPEDDIQIMLE
jgi:tetratricopeptide (TPR) repeat protein